MKPNLEDLCSHLTSGRRRNQELSPICRAVVYSLSAAGFSEVAISRLFHVSRKAVHHAIELWLNHQTFDALPRNGRPEKLTRREKRYIITLLKKERDIAQKALLSSLGGKISPFTLRRYLRAQNLRKWKAKKRIPLSKELAKERLRFANE